MHKGKNKDLGQKHGSSALLKCSKAVLACFLMQKFCYFFPLIFFTGFPYRAHIDMGTRWKAWDVPFQMVSSTLCAR